MNIFVAISFFFLIANFEGNLELEFDVEKQHVLLTLLLHFIKFSFRKVVLFFSYFQQHWVLFLFHPFWFERQENEWCVILFYICLITSELNFLMFIGHLLVFFSELPIQTSCFCFFFLYWDLQVFVMAS